MTVSRKTIFISDLHLEENQPEITRRFLHFLDSCHTFVDAIYILGDLFEVWIGDDDDTPFNRKIISALKKVTEDGLPIYFLPGNRDFLIGKQFLTETGCQLIPEEEKILLYRTPILLMHGDSLCVRDIAYLRWRKISRNSILNKLLFLLWPLSFRRKFANKMRRKSTQHTRYSEQAMMDVTQEAVDKVMQKHNVQFLIHGHTHKPQFHHFLVNDVSATRIVLGAWHDKGTILVWDECGKKELVEF